MGLIIVQFRLLSNIARPQAPRGRRARTAAGLLEVVAAIGELETRVVAVAWLVARALDNRVRRLLLYDAA